MSETNNFTAVICSISSLMPGCSGCVVTYGVSGGGVTDEVC